MAIIHRNLPDSELHEPKGVSAAAADQVYVTDGSGSGTFRPYANDLNAFSTASGGKVYVSDGVGSGTLQDYDKEPKGISTASADQVYVANGSGSGTWSDFSTVPPTFAGMLSQNDSTISISAASDSTLQTNSDYVPLNNTNMWSVEAGENITSSASSGQFTVVAGGTYQISLCAAFSADIKGRVGFIFGDGTYFETKRTIVDVDTAETAVVMSVMIPNVSANTVYGVYVAAEGNTTLTVQTATFAVQRLS